MSTEIPVAVVKRMLQAFGDRDLDRVVETVHPDSRWTYVGVNPRPAKDIDDTVVIVGFESGTFNATGNSFRNEWAQKYVVQNGLIIEMEEYNIQVKTAS